MNQVTLPEPDRALCRIGQIGIIGSERIDINIHDPGDATTAGPAVGLIGTP